MSLHYVVTFASSGRLRERTHTGGISMARNQGSESPQSGQERSLSRREGHSFPSFSGDLFSLSPFALLREMTDWMDRSMSGGQFRSGGAGQSGVWSPALEVYQKDNNMVVRADLPGVEP